MFGCTTYPVGTDQQRVKWIYDVSTAVRHGTLTRTPRGADNAGALSISNTYTNLVFHECVAYDAPLSDSQMLQVKNELVAKWSV